MASFVLVHGSWQNASCWSAVKQILEERGHEVACPELAKRATEATLEDHARTIADHVPHDDAIVVAHSFSGAFLPLVPAMRRAARSCISRPSFPSPARACASSSSIVATQDRTITPQWSRRATHERLGIEPIEIDAGHCPQNSRPHDTAELLERVSARS